MDLCSSFETKNLHLKRLIDWYEFGTFLHPWFFCGNSRYGPTGFVEYDSRKSLSSRRKNTGTLVFFWSCNHYFFSNPFGRFLCPIHQQKCWYYEFASRNQLGYFFAIDGNLLLFGLQEKKNCSQKERTNQTQKQIQSLFSGHAFVGAQFFPHSLLCFYKYHTRIISVFCVWQYVYICFFIGNSHRCFFGFLWIPDVFWQTQDQNTGVTTKYQLHYWNCNAHHRIDHFD